MTNLNTMYPGVANSPETFLKENVAPEGTTIYVNDTSVFGDLPTLAVIGTDQNAETVLVKSKRSDGGLEVQRAIEGFSRRWEKTTLVARNFTNYDYEKITENIKKLNESKVGKVDGKGLSVNDFTDSFKNQLDNLNVISSETDSDGIYKVVEYKNKSGQLVFKSELLGDTPYKQIRLTTYVNGTSKESQIWNLYYDKNEFIYKKELRR